VNAELPLKYYVIPWSSVLWGIAGVPMVLAALLLPHEELGRRLAGGGFGLFLAVIGVFVLRKRLATLRIAEKIEYRRPFLHLDFPITSAKSISVERTLSVHRPSFWDVVVEVNGKDIRLPLGAHIWFGARLQGRAETIASRLQIPIVDPVGDVWRRSRFPPMRLLGAGHGWLFMLGAIALLAPVIVGCGLLLSGG
jgi:hypothetical protein